MALKNQWEKRVQVFHYIYQILITDASQKDIVKNAFENYGFDANQMKIVEYYAANQKEIKKIISAHLSKNWTWDRIPFVNKAILISAYCEAKTSSLDKKIIIDQALITTNKYCELNDEKFINAILDKIIN